MKRVRLTKVLSNRKGPNPIHGTPNAHLNTQANENAHCCLRTRSSGPKWNTGGSFKMLQRKSFLGHTWLQLQLKYRTFRNVDDTIPAKLPKGNESEPDFVVNSEKDCFEEEQNFLSLSLYGEFHEHGAVSPFLLALTFPRDHGAYEFLKKGDAPFLWRWSGSCTY